MKGKGRALAAVAGAVFFGRKTPLVATLSITDRCNRRCGYCEAGGGKDLPLHVILDVIRQARRSGAARINLTGGEPLLRDDAGEMIRYAASLGLDVDLCTNGDLVGRRIEYLTALHSASVSLDGPPALNDAHRGEGSFSNALGAARLLRLRGVPTTFSCLICQGTLSGLDELLDVAEGVGVGVSFQPALARKLMSGDPNPFAPGIGEYRETIDALIDRKRSGRAVANSINGLKFLRNWPETSDLGRCVWGRLVCRMEADGALYMCGERGVEGAQAESIHEGGFEKAFLRLAPSRCDACWGASRVELRLLARGRLGPLWRLMRSGRIGSK